MKEVEFTVKVVVRVEDNDSGEPRWSSKMTVTPDEINMSGYNCRTRENIIRGLGDDFLIELEARIP